MLKHFSALDLLVISKSLIYYSLDNFPFQTDALQNATTVEYTNQQDPTSAFLFVSRFCQVFAVLHVGGG
jgi:hypothetical protein